jgi:hypothetical protein
LTGIGRAPQDHLISGRTSTLRKMISAPSDWIWIFPSVRFDLAVVRAFDRVELDLH